MDKELKRQLEWMNQNLNTMIANQAMIYAVLESMAKSLEGQKERE